MQNLVIDASKYDIFKLSSDGSSLSFGGDISVVSNKLVFFKNLLLAYVDSYLVVALTIHNLMTKGITVDQNRLVNELHIAI